MYTSNIVLQKERRKKYIHEKKYARIIIAAVRIKGSKIGKTGSRGAHENGGNVSAIFSLCRHSNRRESAPKTPCIHASPSLCTRYNMRLHCDSAIVDPSTGRSEPRPLTRGKCKRVRRSRRGERGRG